MYIAEKILFYCNVSVEKCKKMPPKVISYYDLTFVLKGSLVYIVDGVKYTVNENDAVLIKPNSVRERLAGSVPAEYVSFNFLIRSDCTLDLKTFNKSVINRDIKKLISIFSQRHLSPAHHSKEKCCNILNYILYEIIDVCDLKTNNEHIVKILRYIDSNPSAPLSLSEISAAVHLSKEYTASLFKKEIGKTVTEYICERKMLQAKEMIKYSEMSLQSIATDLGFNNYGYFSKKFKNYFGISPVKLRKQRFL